MFLLRILLSVVLLYYLLKILGKWLFPRDKTKRTTGGGRSGGKERYRNLTDQAIDDADYEEIEGEGKR